MSGERERRPAPAKSENQSAQAARKPLPKGGDPNKPVPLRPGEKPLPKKIGPSVPTTQVQHRHTTTHERGHDLGNGALDGAERHVSRAEAEIVVIAAADIVQHGRRSAITSAPARFRSALELLYTAVTAKDHLGGADQVQYLDAAMVTLEPAVTVFRHDQDDAIWLDEQLMQLVASRRSSARYTRAVDRVDNSLRIDGATIEMPSDEEPRKQAALIHQEIKKLAPEMLELNEQVLRAAHHGIEHEAEKLLEGEGKGRKLDAGRSSSFRRHFGWSTASSPSAMKSSDTSLRTFKACSMASRRTPSS